jgi:hypothetical protein
MKKNNRMKKKTERKEEDERRRMKKMKPRLLCPWSFILGFSDEILNINIFKIIISDSVYEVKLKFLICMKNFINPLQILPMAFHYIGDFIGKRVNNQQSKRELITSALEFQFR